MLMKKNEGAKVKKLLAMDLLLLVWVATMGGLSKLQCTGKQKQNTSFHTKSTKQNAGKQK